MMESFKAWMALNPLEQLFDNEENAPQDIQDFAYEMTKNVEGVRKPEVPCRWLISSGILRPT